jgi:metal-dependent amidase/aminoacylase/carboxypeptidase family protein
LVLLLKKVVCAKSYIPTLNIVVYPDFHDFIGGGKIKLIDAGLYRDHDIDVSLMAHPVDTRDAALCRSSAISIFKVEYFGKAAHAAMNPYQGVVLPLIPSTNLNVH